MSAEIGRLVFETSLGWMGIEWNPRGLTRLVLPGSDRDRVARRLARGADGSNVAGEIEAAPENIRRLIPLLSRYADGEAVEFGDVAVDLDGVDDFRRAIYAEARKLRFGETVTYGELAARAGHPGLARETGQALGQNPVPIVIPCHRIMAAGGKIGGFSAPGGSATKERMLAMEGVRVGPPPPAQTAFAF